jgi:uncharacterized membrane protein
MIKSLLFLHLFFATLWVGGMAYTLLFLRPSLKSLPEGPKQSLVQNLYGRFFLGVWLFLFALMVLNFAYIYFFQYRKGKFSAIPSLIAINFVFAIIICLIISWIA